ncbi:MAG: hypothetical protein H8D67_29205 [Deltaproteobacteria bacterium]|nr:hypothetical protein [Deltaproteobacteria bacterium]MBL7205186.1 hypothetical protein [Desulfobacteraceae bacterium]
MNQETVDALDKFFSAQKKLNELGIIRSRDYIGDVARYLCREVYNLEPSKGRRIGHDGTIGDSKIRIAVNNCPIGTKVFLQEPFEFDELIVVLGPNCKLRPAHLEGDFLFYRYTKDETVSKFKTPKGSYIGGKDVFSEGHDRVLNLR